jgi:hypothetical protein
VTVIHSIASAQSRVATLHLIVHELLVFLVVPVVIRVNLPSYALQPRNDTVVGAHCGRADQGPEMDPRSRSRLVERAVVGEGG